MSKRSKKKAKAKPKREQMLPSIIDRMGWSGLSRYVRLTKCQPTVSKMWYDAGSGE